MTAWRAIALAAFALLLPGTRAWGEAVVVRFSQSAEECSAVVRWELLAARIDRYTPNPGFWDATLVATISRTDASGACGSAQSATVEVRGMGGPTRFWLRLVASSGVAVSGSMDAILPEDAPTVELTTVGGGGNAASDCLLVLVAPVNHPATRPRMVRCTDGDPSCDADGTVNGECTVPVAACANSTFSPGRCISPGVESISLGGVAGDNRPYDPDAALLQAHIDAEIAPPSSRADACTRPVMVRVPLTWGGARAACRPSRKKQLMVVTLELGRPGGMGRDLDRLAISCRPPAEGCDPALAPSGG